MTPGEKIDHLLNITEKQTNLLTLLVLVGVILAAIFLADVIRQWRADRRWTTRSVDGSGYIGDGRAYGEQAWLRPDEHRLVRPPLPPGEYEVKPEPIETSWRL